MVSLFTILLLLLDVLKFIVFAHVIMSWLIGFNVLNTRQPLVWQIWNGLERLLEPLYRPIRRILPDLGGLDLTPLVALLVLYALRIVSCPTPAASTSRPWCCCSSSLRCRSWSPTTCRCRSIASLPSSRAL